MTSKPRTLLLLSLCALVLLSLSSASASSASLMDEDPTTVVDRQFGAVQPITSTSSVSDVLQWLDSVSEIMGRVALGGLPTIPSKGYDAVETLKCTVVASSRLLNDDHVLRKVLQMLPSLWSAGYWYAPIATWKPKFSSIYTTSVARAKSQSTLVHDTALNSTSLMIRFTKDNTFFDGQDHGSQDDARLLKSDYLRYLPELVSVLASSAGHSVSISLAQLRHFMSSIPSKTDNMDMSVAFPVYVDTAVYAASDAAALSAFLAESS